MEEPALAQLSTRCRANDTTGIAARVHAATWTCPTCGELAPTVEVLAGWAYVHRQRCQCQEQAQSVAQKQEAARQVVAQRDRERMQRAIGGMEPGMHAWQMRFETFEPERQREAFETCLGWTQMMIATAANVRRTVHDLSSTADGRADPLAVQLQFLPIWHTELANVPNILLLGSTGLGKTHLSLSVYHALIDDDLKAVYAPGMALLDQIRDRWDRDDPDHTEEQLIERLIQAEILLVDGPDMSARPWSTTRWFRILDGRSAHGRPTMIAGTSEKRLLAALGAEGYDRLCEQGCVVHLCGTSYRRLQMVSVDQLRRQVASLPEPPASTTQEDA